MQRPFLSLKSEMYNRMTWRMVIICLVTSPTMFKQARSLLHSWFLKTGFPFIMEFQIVAVSSLLDMISRPMSWGVSMELGLKYSHSHAYFPSQCHQLLGVLNGYITCKSFLAMIHHIKIAVAQIMEPIFHPNKCHSSHATLGHEAILDVIGENSTWAMLMNFPTWFYFASALLFFDKDWNTYFSNDIAAKIDVESVNQYELVEAAILCLSWVMSPCSKGNLDRLAEHFHKTSRSWSTVSSTQTSSHEKCSSIGTHKKGAVSCNKKLRIQKACNDKFKLVATKNSFSSLARWLRKFDGFVAQSKMKSFLSHESSYSFAETELMSRRSKLFTQIPLGILISCPNFLKDKECELLLYYATTGDISHFSDVHTDADEHHERDFSSPSGTEGRKWGLDGTRLVFSFSDIIEDMSAMLFDCENTRLDYICLLKGKICGYLLRCVKEFLNIYVPNLGEHRGSVDLLDLVKRLTMWKQQGREVFDGCEEFDDFVNGLATKVSLLKEKDEH
ncbi:hypothetical protein AXF42_Ash005228 [Apostasia shenzhenica]|uniref:Uncharacterized protein n=1 Tax=Apostasia shenzhenica TaxID=1088818 RepID=A0A2I0B6A8_9ASPA|nr:hypothetical protein AXF42_Ash005228 [Apostasia shenzhenica]